MTMTIIDTETAIFGLASLGTIFSLASAATLLTPEIRALI